MALLPHPHIHSNPGSLNSLLYGMSRGHLPRSAKASHPEPRVREPLDSPCNINDLHPLIDRICHYDIKQLGGLNQPTPYYERGY